MDLTVARLSLFMLVTCYCLSTTNGNNSSTKSTNGKLKLYFVFCECFVQFCKVLWFKITPKYATSCRVSEYYLHKIFNFILTYLSNHKA
jgi:hypothetical protein